MSLHPLTADCDLIRVRLVHIDGRPQRMAEMRVGSDLWTWFPPDEVSRITASDVLRHGFPD